MKKSRKLIFVILACLLVACVGIPLIVINPFSTPSNQNDGSAQGAYYVGLYRGNDGYGGNIKIMNCTKNQTFFLEESGGVDINFDSSDVIMFQYNYEWSGYYHDVYISDDCDDSFGPIFCDWVLFFGWELSYSTSFSFLVMDTYSGSCDQYLTLDFDGQRFTKKPCDSLVFPDKAGYSVVWQDNQNLYNYNSGQEYQIGAEMGSEGTSWWGGSTGGMTSCSSTVSFSVVSMAGPYTFPIAFDGNGADSGSTTSVTATYGTSCTLTENGFSKTGYSFAGWATSADGVVVFENKDTLTADEVNSLYLGNGITKTLYAKWTINTYTLSFKNGYYFSSSGYPVELTAPGCDITNSTLTQSNSTSTVSHTYSTEPITITLSCSDARIFSGFYSQSISYTENSAYGKRSFSWVPNENGNVIWFIRECKDVATIAEEGIERATFSNHAWSAWLEKDVTFSNKFTQNIQADFVATLKTGYVFDGWYNGSTKVSSSLTYAQTIREDLTLTAKATKIYGMIHYDETDQYFYFEDGLYPQGYIGSWAHCQDLTAKLSAGTITPAYFLTIAGKECPVCEVDGVLYMQYYNTNPVTISFGGSSIYIGQNYFWFRLDPIVWRVSPRGVSVDYYSDVLYDRFEADGIYCVSDKVLDWTYVDKVDFQNGDIQTGWSYTDSDLYAATSSNYTNLSSTFVSAAEGSYMFDKIPSVGTNTKIASSSKSVAGLVQASVRDIDSLFQTNYDEIIAASGYNVENPNFDKSARKAYASDLVCVLAGVNYNQYCGYSTRDLYDTQNGFRISAGGSKGNLWLDGDQGVRYVYAYNRESTLVPGDVFNVKIKQYFDATTADHTAQDENVSSITFDFYDAGGGYFVDGQDVTTNDSVNVSTNADGSIKAYFVENGDGLTDVYVLSNQIIKVDEAFYMFGQFSKVTDILLRNFDTSNVTYMSFMFDHCDSLTGLGVSNFDTSNVKDMGYMFNSCDSLTSLDLSNFDTSNVMDMGYMFSGCSALTSLDVSSFDTSSVRDMSYMFSGCSALTSLDVSGFDTSGVTDMSCMFSGCSALTSLDVSSFDTSSVTTMRSMFSSCSTLTSLDLSSFDTSSVTDMYCMFFGCSNLATIYVGSNWSTTNVTSSILMFSACENLVGGNGTSCDGRYYTDATYACVDTSSTPGYLTLKS